MASQPTAKPSKAEIAAMLRNEERNREHVGFTLACQALLADAGGPVSVRDFAIRLHHRGTDDMYAVLSAFDGHKDETLHAIRDAERRWWATGFGDLVLEVLHAAVVSGVAVVKGRGLGGFGVPAAPIEPGMLAAGRLDVDRCSLVVDYATAPVEIVSLEVSPAPGASAPVEMPRVAAKATTAAKGKLPKPTAGRPRKDWEDIAHDLHDFLGTLKESGLVVPRRITGTRGHLKVVPPGRGEPHFLHMKITQRDVWEHMPEELRTAFGSFGVFETQVAGVGKAEEGCPKTLKDQAILEALRDGDQTGKRKTIGKGLPGKPDKENKYTPTIPRLFWADIRDGKAE